MLGINFFNVVRTAVKGFCNQWMGSFGHSLDDNLLQSSLDVPSFLNFGPRICPLVIFDRLFESKQKFDQQESVI
jgi:hypothetical protein